MLTPVSRVVIRRMVRAKTIDGKPQFKCLHCGKILTVKEKFECPSCGETFSITLVTEEEYMSGYILCLYKKMEKMVLSDFLARRLIPWEDQLVNTFKKPPQKIMDLKNEADYFAEHVQENPDMVYLTIFKKLYFVPKNIQPLSILLPFEKLKRVIQDGKLERMAETIRVKYTK